MAARSEEKECKFLALLRLDNADSPTDTALGEVWKRLGMKILRQPGSGGDSAAACPAAGIMDGVM